MHSFALLLALGLSASPSVNGLSFASGSWTAVTQLVGGTELRVELDAGSVTGRFLKATPSTLTLSVNGRETSIATERVGRIARRPPPHRSRHLGIGLVAGLIVGGVAYSQHCDNCMSEGAAPFTAPSMGAGALIGAMLPAQHGWETIYERLDASATPDWADVMALPSDTEVRVETKWRWPFTCVFLSATDDALIVRQGKQLHRYAQSEITHLERRAPGSDRGRHANMGLLAGLGVGLVRTILCDGCNDFGRSLVIVPSVTVGAIVGATRSPARWETIYRR